ncbi:NAD(P)H-dependent oxidoreductase [Micromonospora sp. NPDC048999]|uniref:NADPH-dependent FMN reductase n=1 Tax=Micromonospora sp. NPDC048999 TaxID=3155391 RepID=UPI0033FDA17B
MAAPERTEHDAGRQPVVILSGNPRPGSRTMDAATRLAQRVPASGTRHVVDLAQLAGHVYEPGHARIEDALAAVRSAEVLIVATPVYKASFTGLLKSFLDLLPADSLASATAIPVVVSASVSHRLLTELHLRIVLRELGATLPSTAVLLDEGHLADLDPVLDAWAEQQIPVLQTARAVLGRPRVR